MGVFLDIRSLPNDFEKNPFGGSYLKSESSLTQCSHLSSTKVKMHSTRTRKNPLQFRLPFCLGLISLFVCIGGVESFAFLGLRMSFESHSQQMIALDWPLQSKPALQSSNPPVKADIAPKERKEEDKNIFERFLLMCDELRDGSEARQLNNANEEKREHVPKDSSAERREVAAKAAILSKKSGGPPKNPKITPGKQTSVGERRVGSATRARHGLNAHQKAVENLRKTARGTAAGSPKEDDENEPKPKLSQSLIHSAIEDLWRSRQGGLDKGRRELDIPVYQQPMGLLGGSEYTVTLDSHQVYQGSVILESKGDVSVRLATPLDDLNIATLRLSVFSDFAPELYSRFCTRSCQAIASRRALGATCVVATPARGSTGSQNVLGSAECSFHEFYGTQLGCKRPVNSILYITEVAVHPSARRQGVGLLLLQAIEKLAIARRIETLYLHVDVKNNPAISLYMKAGYRKLNPRVPMFMEFTKSLNLHPGATKGREHYLLYRDLTPKPTWVDEKRSVSINNERQLVGSLGFEIPA